MGSRVEYLSFRVLGLGSQDLESEFRSQSFGFRV